MKKTNQKGFGTVETILIVAIVGIVAGVGYYVYNSQRKTNTSLDSATSSQRDGQKQTTLSTTAEAVKSVDENPDWKSYTSEHGFSLKYPQDWVLTKKDSPKGLEDLSIDSNPNSKGDNFVISVGIIEGYAGQYTVQSNAQTLTNGLRVRTQKEPGLYIKGSEATKFDCANMWLLDKTTNSNVKLLNKGQSDSSKFLYISSYGEFEFCIFHDTPSTKSYQEQLDSSQWQTAQKIFSSINTQ